MAAQNIDDDIRQSLNEAKKQKLQERYGAKFVTVADPLPAQVERDWLNQVEEFERQFAERGMTTVRKYIGNPTIAPLAEVPPHRLEAEVDRLLRLLAEHDIQIDYEGLIGAAETYDFIATELLDQEIEDIRVPGMVTVFVYGRYTDMARPDQRTPN